MERGAVVAALVAAALQGVAVEVRAQETPAAVEASEEGGLTLRDALALALERNRTLEQARLGLESAGQQVREAWGEIMPSVDLTTSLTHNLGLPVSFLPARIFDPTAGEDELIGVKFGSDNQWSLALTAEQPLFAAGSFVGLGAADGYVALQREAVRGTAQQTVTDVRLAYYDVLLGQEAVRLRENSLARVRQSLEETRAMHRVGLASEYDVLRLEVEESNLEPTVRQAENQVAAARRTLGILIGVDRPDTLRVDGRLTAPGDELLAAVPTAADGGEAVRYVALSTLPPLPSQDQLVQQALEHRSDLRQLELEQGLRRIELRVEQAEYLPTITLFGNYLITAQDNGWPNFFGSGDGQRAYGRQVGVRVTLPVFSGFQRPARIEQKEAQIGQVAARYRLAVDRAESEVRSLAEATTEAAARASAQRRAVQQARRGYEIASVSYREGLSSRLEVTDAELALRESEFNHAQAVYDYLVARARLDAATGMVPYVDAGASVALRN